MSTRTIITDVGGVLIHFDYPRFFRFLALVLDTNVDRVVALWTDRGPDALLYRFSRGDLDLPGLWEGFRRQFGVLLGGDEHAFRIFWLAGSQGLMPDTFRVLRAAKERHGLRVVSCTNTDPIFGQELRSPGDALHGFFAAEVQSWQVRAMKPERAMYERALEVAEAKPSECLFIDDLPENVRAAECLDMYGHRFTNAAALTCELERLGIPLK